MNLSDVINLPWVLSLPWVQYLLATDAPALPPLLLMQWAQTLGWGVVLAWLGVWVAGWYAAGRPGPGAASVEVDPDAPDVPSVNQGAQRALQVRVAVVAAASVLLPGPWSPAYWLGLAFQTPSVTTVLLCAVLLYRGLTAYVMTDAMLRSSRNSLLAQTVMGVALGWVLLLDTFAVLPVQFYSWGFSPVAVALVALATLLPWAICLRGPLDPVAWAAPLAGAVFVLLRLPSGNVWDAVLDPWLWVVLQVVVVRRWRGRASYRYATTRKLLVKPGG
jgi:hypothetical protein